MDELFSQVTLNFKTRRFSSYMSSSQR